MGGFRKGGFSNNRLVLKPDVAIASEVLILSKTSLAITDFHAKKTQHVPQFCLKPPSWNHPIRDSQHLKKCGAFFFGKVHVAGAGLRGAELGLAHFGESVDQSGKKGLLWNRGDRL